jgi:uncharacterized protein (DUF924 family)
MPLATAHDVLAFWFSDAAKPNWFARSDAFDAAVREALLPLHERAATGELDVWAEAAEGALASCPGVAAWYAAATARPAFARMMALRDAG